MKKFILLVLTILCLSSCVINIDKPSNTSNSLVSLLSTSEESNIQSSVPNPWDDLRSINYDVLKSEENDFFSNQAVKIDNQSALIDFFNENHIKDNNEFSVDYFLQKSLIFIGFKHASNEKNINIAFINEFYGHPSVCISYEEIGTDNLDFKNDIYFLEVDKNDVVDWEMIVFYVYNVSNGSNTSTYFNNEIAELGNKIDFNLTKYNQGYGGCIVCNYTKLINSFDELEEYQKEYNNEIEFNENSLITMQFDYSQLVTNMSVLRLVKEYEKIIVVLSTNITEEMSSALSSHYFELFITKNNLIDVRSIVFKFVNYNNSTWYDSYYTIKV